MSSRMMTHEEWQEHAKTAAEALAEVFNNIGTDDTDIYAYSLQVELASILSQHLTAPQMDDLTIIAYCAERYDKNGNYKLGNEYTALSRIWAQKWRAGQQ